MMAQGNINNPCFKKSEFIPLSEVTCSVILLVIRISKGE
jgi:hypothetical protein